MKKTLAVLLAVLLCLSMAACGAENETAAVTPVVTVYVTIADAGVLEAAQTAVEVPDGDGDGTCSIDEALRAAHDALYAGGAEAGYASAETEYGLSLTRLWGVENGGSYGYYVNDAAAMSLSDPLREDDRVVAYSYADLSAWSDMYSFFDVTRAEVAAGEELTLTLSGAGYDEAWNPITVGVEGAALTVNGAATEWTTGADGAVTFTLGEAGEYVVSAVSESELLVPPVCVVTVK